MAVQEKNLKKLLNAIGDVEITEKEMHTLKWISVWSVETIDNICSVIEKVKKEGDVK
ncbi:hypothetical protein [Clostridium sp. AWRP]|uniref:hypothetical protein n=1 Tax=Clostridium sp. AWRP TaxID=2212991 RepID=UPI001585DE98|nr:hypothetical protein [Clostridium sp. AWRP]